MDAQIIALELIANFCAEDEKAEDKEFVEMDEYSLDDEQQDSSQPIDEQVKLIILSGVCDKITLKCIYPIAKVQQLLMSYPGLNYYWSTFSTLQMRALGCLGNIVLSSNIAMLGDATGLWKFSVKVCDELIQASKINIQAVEDVTGIMWTLLRKNHPKFVFEISPPEVEGIYKIASAPTSEIVRTNAIGMLGVIGQISSFAHLVPSIGALLTGCLSDQSAWVLAEALNAIFDIFAEEQFNSVVKHLNLMEKLQLLIPHLTNLIKKREAWKMYCWIG